MARTDSELAKHIGKSIAKYRHNKALTQSQVAEYLGVSIDAISRMERGGIMPTVTRLIQLAEIFDCKASSFLRETSPLVNDQTQRIINLLSKLEESDRAELLDIIEKMVNWRLQNNQTNKKVR